MPSAIQMKTRIPPIFFLPAKLCWKDHCEYAVSTLVLPVHDGGKGYSMHYWMWHWTPFCYLLIGGLAIGFFGSLATVSFGAPTSDDEMASTILAGMRNHVERLASGIVEIEVVNQPGNRIFKLSVAFDTRRESVRCDTKGSVFSIQHSVRILQTKDAFLQFVERRDGGLLMRLNPGERSQIEFGTPIDVTAGGFCNYDDLAFGATSKLFLREFEVLKRVSLVIDKGVAKWVQEENQRSTRTQIAYWIDTSLDYVPLRNEVRTISSSGEA